ncbi:MULTISPECIES: hypothetical protein [Brevibacillus]|uniref:hypothetical protein n=1 Tax=Brevibacillus TaxID=55080 RepID=UPI000D0ED348|nr:MULTISPECIES: hypothetical protein [Brevibacillus]MED1947088.1 hypothetical protein [Brevibacillus formosus]MED2000436.1 hypothetical protein [Brevibacillus formosus]MED2085775.1 hypothetical protein [Brevibacillus formosus]PSK13466.1 hypothetical protein C7R94_22545 [Brevibacillus sp. NRRL NRS-603]
MDFQQVVRNWNSLINELERLDSMYSSFSETDTRCKIIDPIIKEVFGWQEDTITREPKISAGYIDYYCESSKNKFVLEAKRTGVPFRIPRNQERLISKTLEKSCPELFEAIEQARSYARQKNCPFCIVSNGLSLIFIKTYPANDKTIDVISYNGKESIEKSLHIIYSLISPYSSSSEQLFLEALSASGEIRNEPQFRKTILGTHYFQNRLQDFNALASILRPLLHKYFGEVTNVKEHERDKFMQEVYCVTNNLDNYGDELKIYLKNRIPFFGNPVKQVITTKDSSGDFGQDLKMEFQKDSGHVFLLLGNVGAGKTTFMHRFYSLLLEEVSKRQLVWIHIDFLKLKKSGKALHDFINDSIMSVINENYQDLDLTSLEALLKIYEDEISRLKKGRWKLILSMEEKLNDRLHDFLEERESDLPNHIRRIFNYIQQKLNKVICIVFDNVDQLDTKIQLEISHYAFAEAENSKTLIVVSLRDETFWNIRTRLPIDAFSNFTHYQIIPPEATQLIQKRISYTKNLLGTQQVNFDVRRAGKPIAVSVRIKDVFEVLDNTISTQYTKGIIENLSSGNMRQALELFRDLVTSGHTDVSRFVNNMVLQERPKLYRPDEVLKSLALTDYVIYNSEKSKIINLFTINKDGFFSHFVTIRILQVLRDLYHQSFGHDLGEGYVPISRLLQDLSPYVKDESALRLCIIPLLRYFLIDSDIGSRRPDENEQNYYDEVKLLRITPAGIYYLDEIMYSFEYLELVLHDTPICNEEKFSELSYTLNSLRTNHLERSDYWKTRIKAVELFVSYLGEQEDNDQAYLEQVGLQTRWGKIVPRIRSEISKKIEEIKARNNITA